jgi:hypothetical protein
MIDTEFQRGKARRQFIFSVVAAVAVVCTLALLGTFIVQPLPVSYVLAMIGVWVLLSLVTIYLTGRLGLWLSIIILVVGSSVAEYNFLGDPRGGTLRWWQSAASVLLLVSLTLLVEFRSTSARRNVRPN